MDKREFLKTSGALVAGTMLSRLAPAQRPADTRTNWSGTYTYSTDHLDLPKTAEEVQSIVQGHGHLKALGGRHSFNSIADSTEDQVSLQNLNQIDLDTTAGTVTVGAGVRYGQLAPYIDSRGYAVHNLASLPHITVVGACATATHGSGIHNGNLSTAVRAMEIVTADGKLVKISRETVGDSFPGLVVGLGALGIITRITIAVEPTFQMDQVVYEDLSFNQLEHNLESIFGAAYSVSLFTDWQKHRATQVWIKRRLDGNAKRPYAPEFYGAKAATRKLHPIGDHPAESCTDQLGIPGPWYERLPHFRMNFTPSSGAEIQTEYFVPVERGYEAILAVEQLRDKITPHLFVTELRTIAADDLWVSPCYQRRSMAIHFTWKPEWPAVKQILPLIEAKLAPFQPRPHWAKMFTIAPAQIQAQYTRMADYKVLVAKYDPQGKFRNAFLNTNLYGT
jgi:xylitol oxidase